MYITVKRYKKSADKKKYKESGNLQTRNINKATLVEKKVLKGKADKSKGDSMDFAEFRAIN